MDVRTVTAEDPHVPAEAHPLLLPHQKHTLAALWGLESSCNDLDAGDARITTRVGVYGDKAGSGKSYVIAEMMLKRGAAPAATNYINQITDHMSIRYGAEASAREPVPLNLLVVPHNIVTQWKGVLEHMSSKTEKEYLAAYRITDLPTARAELEKCKRREAGAVKVLMISASLFSDVMLILRSLEMKLHRMVFDEADNIRLKTGYYATPAERHDGMARFNWLVTASLQNLFGGSSIGGRINILHSDRSVVHSSIGRFPMSNSTHIRDMLRTYVTNLRNIYNKIIVITDNAFIDQSFNLMPPEEFAVACTAPLHTRILRGIAENEILSRLNAGDIGGAVSMMSPERTGSESNIVALAVSQMNTALENARAEYDFVMRRVYHSREAGEHARQRALGRVEKAERDVENVKRRIREATACPICYESISTKTIVPCCNNSFCLNCITAWVASRHRASCPMCKKDLKISNFMVCCETAQSGETSVQRDEYTQGGVVIDKTLGKADNLDVLLSAIANAPDAAVRKILFFSDNEYANENVAEPAMRRAGINYGVLKGNVHCMNKRLKDFKSDGSTQALLINCSHYGCGLDLSKATDLILYHRVNPRLDHQVVGRAQRPPRAGRLRVWRFLHEGETM